MKYEVIGWAACDDEEFTDLSPVTACAELAARREIAEHGYCFGGDRHEEYCPILNDGSRISLSWRGWGGLMARARGEDEEFGYMHYYMNMLIAPSLLKYPKGWVQPERIVPRLTLAERFEMHLRDDMFDAMARGAKRVEFRLFDDKRKAIDIGDYIEFHGHGGRILKRVSNLFVDTDFKKLFTQLTDRGAYSAEDFGFPAGTSATDFAHTMSEIYPPERQKSGVMAFALEDAVPRYFVSFFVWTIVRGDLVQSQLSFDEFIELPLFTDPWELAEKLQQIADFKRCAGGFRRFTEGTDPEQAIGAVLGDLYGKEDALRALAREVGLAFTFEITALFPDMPPASPVLGAAAEEFLRNLKAEVHITPIPLP